jgi:phosphonate transport system substrate-binding protein
MNYADERVRPLLDMEGLGQWMPGRTSGYATLRAAVERFGIIDEFVRRLTARRM